MGILCGIIGIVVGMIMLVHGQVNVTELDTLDRM